MWRYTTRLLLRNSDLPRFLWSVQKNARVAMFSQVDHYSFLLNSLKCITHQTLHLSTQRCRCKFYMLFLSVTGLMVS